MQNFKISWWSTELFLKVKKKFRRRQKSIEGFYTLHLYHMDALMREPHDQSIDCNILLPFFLEVNLKDLVLNEKYITQSNI